MPSASVLDLAEILTAIPGDNPSGVDLRWEPLYDQIKNARTVEEDMLGQASEDEVNWSDVAQLAIDALTNRSKHLMVGAWLTEALIALYGFAGLRDGLRIIGGLLEQFWDGVYPLPDDGDLEPRAAPLVWLMDADRGARLPNRIREIPLLPHPEESFSWLYWKSRYPAPKGENEDEEAFARRKTLAEERERRFESAAASIEVQHMQSLLEDIQDAKSALGDFERVAEERLGDLAPSGRAFRQALDECEALVRRIVRDKGGFVEATAETEADSGEGSAAAAPAARGMAGPIQSREDAFRRLAEVSAFLRRMEPQSPVPLLIDRAISWGQMPFDQLLREMIKDQAARSQVGELLGIRPGDEGEA